MVTKLPMCAKYIDALTSCVMHKSFVCESCKRHWGWGTCRYFLHSAPVLLSEGDQQSTDPAHCVRFFSGSTLDCRLSTVGCRHRLGRPQLVHYLALDPDSDHWYIACHTEGLSKRKSAIPSCPGVLFPRSNSFRFPHQSKKESEQTCLRNSWQVRRLQYWHARQPHPFARRK